MSLPETRLREAAPQVVPPLDHAGLQRRGRRRRFVRRGLAATGAAVAVTAAVAVFPPSLLFDDAPRPFTGTDQDDHVEAEPAAWPTASRNGVDYRLWSAEEAPREGLPAEADDFDPTCSLWLEYRAPSGARGGWSVCPPAPGVVGTRRFSTVTPGGETPTASVVMTRDVDVHALDVELGAGDRRVERVVQINDLGRVDPGLSGIHAGLVPLAPDEAIQRISH